MELRKNAGNAKAGLLWVQTYTHTSVQTPTGLTQRSLEAGSAATCEGVHTVCTRAAIPAR